MFNFCLLQCKNNFCINVCTWSIFTPFEKKLILNFVEKSAFLMEKLFNQRKKTIKLLSL